MRKIIIYSIVFFQLMVLGSLFRSLYSTYSSRSRVDELREKKVQLTQEREKLLSDLEHANSDYYIEEIAREQLHLGRPGETVLIVDREELRRVLGAQDSKEEEENSNWEKWVRLLTGKGL